jgi:hypothetical protein
MLPIATAPFRRLQRLPLLARVVLAIVAAPLLAGTTPALARSVAASGATGGGNLGEAVSPSTAEQKALAEHLRQRGAVFYGAWWCPHCFHQKNLFGIEAGARLPYVECARDEPGRLRCEAARIRAYPTWDLGGERREGLLTIEELKVWSGFGASKAAEPAATPPSAVKP